MWPARAFSHDTSTTGRFALSAAFQASVLEQFPDCRNSLHPRTGHAGDWCVSMDPVILIWEYTIMFVLTGRGKRRRAGTWLESPVSSPRGIRTTSPSAETPASAPSSETTITGPTWISWPGGAAGGTWRSGPTPFRCFSAPGRKGQPCGRRGHAPGFRSLRHAAVYTGGWPQETTCAYGRSPPNHRGQGRDPPSSRARG